MAEGLRLTPNFFAPSVMSHHVSLEEGDFERSFYYDLLLQPPVCMLDTGFFILREIQDQFMPEKKVGFTWLEAAVNVGAIIPVFREGGSFFRVFSKLREANFAGLTPMAETIARALDDHGVKEFRNFPSPSDYHMGRSLGESLQRLFLRPDPPFLTPLADETMSKLARFWGRTASWRQQWIETALSARDYEQDGLRLSDLYLAAAKALDRKSGQNITSGQEVLVAANRAFKFRDPTRVQDVRALLILMDLVWQENFRTGMRRSGVAMGLCFARWQPLMSYFDLGIMPPANSSTLQGNVDVLEAINVELTIELPTVQVLKKTNGNVFSEIWKGGTAYRNALHRWRQNPTQDNLRVLAHNMEPYSKVIRDAVGRGTPTEKFGVASAPTSYLAAILGGLLSAAAVWATPQLSSLSDVEKGELSTLAGVAPVLVLFPFSLLKPRRVKAKVRQDDIVVGSGARRILLT